MINKFPAIIGADAEMLVDGRWIKGKIVEGYRFDDGVVTIEDENGKQYWCGSARTDCYRQINAEDPDIADAFSETQKEFACEIKKAFSFDELALYVYESSCEYCDKRLNCCGSNISAKECVENIRKRFDDICKENKEWQ